ncbi:MAG: MxaD protein [Gammaproteobacteria bacterium HGW-Gammaproteobacteria-3]|nr:MAG: MxaD protein [Gammaproteobacteria bacterium HGW-Gammaproteobacteria-3]
MKFLLLVNLLIFPITALAHGPTPQKAKESIGINAPPDRVWQAVKQFDALADWHPDIKTSEGDGKHESGGVRTLIFQNGEQITDELDYYSEKDREYSYRLKSENVKALPVSSYSVDLQVTSDADGAASVVTIKSRFYRGDTGNSPPEQLSDEAAVKAMTDYFKSGLAGLKQKLEK